jgi:hypothetical protein
MKGWGPKAADFTRLRSKEGAEGPLYTNPGTLERLEPWLVVLE